MKKTWKETLNKRNGFTLIELVVVIAIIGLLLAMAVPRFTEYQRMAKRAVVDSNARQITTAAMSYTIKESKEPSALGYTATALGDYVENVSGVEIKDNNSGTNSVGVTTVPAIAALVTSEGEYATGYITTEYEGTVGTTTKKYNNSYVTVAYDPVTNGKRVYVGGVYAGDYTTP